MSTVNIDREIQANKYRSTPYTPLFESIVNSLEAIRDADNTDGVVELVFYRNQTGLVFPDSSGSSKSRITGVDIIDNGIGFTDVNTASFDELRSDHKINRGGKGYGRVFYKQYYKSVSVESVFKDELYGDGFILRTFEFTKQDFVSNEIISPVEADEAYTKLTLRDMYSSSSAGLDITLATIARKLLEHLLSYIASEDYKCPKIILRDDEDGESITLNDYLTKTNEIVEVGSDEFGLQSAPEGEELKFKVKTFKIYFSNSVSSVYLTADQRVVTKSSIHEYKNEFKAGFYEELKGKAGKTISRNFILASYVSGDYLNNKVSGERGEFLIKSDASTTAPITQKQIEAKAVEVSAEYVGKEVKERTDKKEKLVAAHVAQEAPWLRTYVKQLDYDSLHYDAKPDDINTALERIKFEDNLKTKAEINNLINRPPADKQQLQSAIDTISDKVTSIGKVDLVQYVVLRKAIIDLFAQALKWDAAKKYNKEDAIHSIIFPLKNTTDTISYNDHNLWMIDERLSFHDYAASDLSAVKGKLDQRPDIVVFDMPILVRNSESLSNPITVIEFKRPQRNNFKQTEDDPLKQVRKYVDKIRSGQYIGENGRTVLASENTPAYGYVVADLTPKMREFCRDNQLVEDPDLQGYHGFHSTWKIYFEVISFDKLLSNAELRNKILFSKLGIS